MNAPRTALLLALFAAGSIASAQVDAPAPSVMPTDPAQILAAAAPVNGLNNDGLKPWHLKAIYETFDRDGRSTGTGTFEEWWGARDRYKFSYTRDGVTQTKFHTAQGTYLASSGGNPFRPDDSLSNYLWLTPDAVLNDRVPTPEETKPSVLVAKEIKGGDVPLRCVLLQGDKSYQSINVGLSPTYCFDETKPVLRIRVPMFGTQIAINDTAYFQGRDIPHRIRVSLLGKNVVTMQLDTLTVWTDFAESDLLPPANALKVDTPPTYAGLAVGGMALRKTPPQYPHIARLSGIQGVVRFQAVVGKDGKVKSLEALSSPDSSLSDAARDAVKQWLYKPYQVNGEPVDAVTLIDVEFRLSS